MAPDVNSYVPYIHVRALDIAKALLDRGYHAPTIYFPLIVKEALMPRVAKPTPQPLRA